jgi:MFS family permease
MVSAASYEQSLSNVTMVPEPSLQMNRLKTWSGYSALPVAAVQEAMFCVGRFLLGAAITINGAAAPTWVMEMAHPRIRGILGGIYMAVWYFIATIVSDISIGTYFYNTT